MQISLWQALNGSYTDVVFIVILCHHKPAQSLCWLCDKQWRTASFLQRWTRRRVGHKRSKRSLFSLSDIEFYIILYTATLSGLKSTGQEPNIAFLAVLKSKLSGLAGKATIVFDTAVTNLGNGYNPSNGEFTAPCSGTYLFSATILADNGGEVWSQFILNEEEVADIYARASDDRHDQGSHTVILHLSKGTHLYTHTWRSMRT